MTSQTNIEQTIDQLAEELTALKKEFQEKSKETLKEIFKLFFQNNPQVKAVVWSQYTPYFNDGDPCTFSVYDIEYFLEEPFDYYEGFSSGSWYKPAEGKVGTAGLTQKELDVIHANFNSFVKFLYKLDDSAYLDMFGDHSLITATKDGFEVNEYYHD